MKLLFLDDSFQRDKNYLGYGGFCVDESEIVNLTAGMTELKRRLRIPESVELKWSPSPRHYLRTSFKGSRQQLYKTCIELLRDHGASVVCAVHSLNDCYGRTLYGWDTKRTILWATRSQLKFLAERFEKPCLSISDDKGLMISDQSGDRSEESTLLEDIFNTLRGGTQFRQFERICMPPLMTDSQFCLPIQLADVVVGIIVSALAGNRYGVELFQDIAMLFMKNPHERAISFASTVSSSVLGYGLILFPVSFRPKGLELFREIDSRYIYTSEGIKEKTKKK
jgi:hypothetical protein